MSHRTKAVFLALACALLPATPLFASAEDQIDNALVVAQAWAAQIDAGRYEESYTFGCDAMRDKITEDKWVEVLRTIRSAWGPVVSRKQISHVFKPDGLEGLNGECMVITYDTSFKRLDTATEVIVLKWEGGKWRGAGYNAGPRASSPDDSGQPTDSSNTEVHTEPHVQPPSQ